MVVSGRRYVALQDKHIATLQEKRELQLKYIESLKDYNALARRYIDYLKDVDEIMQFLKAATHQYEKVNQQN